MKIRFVMLVAAMTVCCTNVQAQDDARKVLGPDSGTCGTWTEARANKLDTSMVFEQLRFWAIGFASGANIYNKNDFLRNIDNRAILVWLDNYCREHPLQTFVQGVVALTNELKNRAQPKPDGQ